MKNKNLLYILAGLVGVLLYGYFRLYKEYKPAASNTGAPIHRTFFSFILGMIGIGRGVSQESQQSEERTEGV